VAASDEALATLRVCTKLPQGLVNCGHCEKCIRTMLSLLAVGALERCPTFGATLEPRRIAALRYNTEGKCLYGEATLQALELAGGYRSLAAALRTSIRLSRRRLWTLVALRQAFPGHHEYLLRLRRKLLRYSPSSQRRATETE
jgi:hypothetical protein